MENKYVHFDEVVEFGNDENGLVTDTKIKQGESLLENNESSTDKDKRIMAAIERRHERMYMVSQALLVFRTSLVSDS